MVPNISHGRPLLAEFRVVLSADDPGTLRLPGQVLGFPSLEIPALRAVGELNPTTGCQHCFVLFKEHELFVWLGRCLQSRAELRCEDGHCGHVGHAPITLPDSLHSLLGSLQPSIPLFILHLSSLSLP